MQKEIDLHTATGLLHLVCLAPDDSAWCFVHIQEDKEKSGVDLRDVSTDENIWQLVH